MSNATVCRSTGRHPAPSGSRCGTAVRLRARAMPGSATAASRSDSRAVHDSFGLSDQILRSRRTMKADSRDMRACRFADGYFGEDPWRRTTEYYLSAAVIDNLPEEKPLPGREL